MSKIYGVFTEKGEFSWRKLMTAGCLFLFMVSVLGNQFKNDFAEMPSAYLAIIGGVFGFYFMKSFFRNVNIGLNKKTDEQN